MTKKKVIDTDLKYFLYESSVQCHEADIEFITDEYKKSFKKSPRVLREDFGGTGAMACDWVKEHKENRAYAIDLDPEPITYGKKHHFSKLSDEEKERMIYIQGNVLDKYPFKADIIVGFNFSYFIFKKRKALLEYFKKARKGLKKDGLFFIDLFGGMESCQELVEETEHDGHSYFWDCDSYNPITAEVQYYIHFKTHSDGKKYDRVFSYDWRMWTYPELIDLLKEAGFSEVISYWEGDEADGTGNGIFSRTRKATNCDSWISYICGVK